MNPCIFLTAFLIGSVTAGSPYPDINRDGCVDLHDVALFQNEVGVVGSLADLNYDGQCTAADYPFLQAVLGGPDCVCVEDFECEDLYGCTDDICAGFECRHVVICQNQNDYDLDCIRYTCTAQGCVPGEEPDGSPCQDPFGCTVDDSCFMGECLTGTTWHAYCGSQDDSDDDCVHPYCEQVGLVFACVDRSEDNSSACDDRNSCTIDDMCFFGACSGTSLPNGTACDDGVDCTFGERCVSGQCTQAIPDDSLCGNQDDGDADCYHDVCDRDTGCFTDLEPFGAPCEDGVSCTAFDYCQGGVCASGYDTCGGGDDDADCLTGVCDLVEGMCVQAVERDESFCDDGIMCTHDRCISGECRPLNYDSSLCGNFNDNDADCVRSLCTGGGGDGCESLPEKPGSPCDDGIPCTYTDYCDGDGVCQPGFLNDDACPNQDYCDNDCIEYRCDAFAGCVVNPEPNSAPCRDFFCDLNGQYSACNVSGQCECRKSPAPDFGCPP